MKYTKIMLIEDDLSEKDQLELAVEVVANYTELHIKKIYRPLYVFKKGDEDKCEELLKKAVLQVFRTKVEIKKIKKSSPSLNGNSVKVLGFEIRLS